jgi:alpha-tubulin suppressor-like RCC1 family protein
MSDGTARCWGEILNGRLGYPDVEFDIGGAISSDSVGPIQVGGEVTAIAAGSGHTCARLAVGDVVCWGFGALGRLGYANTETIGDDENPVDAGTVHLGTNLHVTGIGAGNTHTCAIVSDGSARCWGSSAYGQLGYANTDTVGDDETPASAGQVDLAGALTSISVGADHTCGLLADGGVTCWGAATNGRLGYGNQQNVGDDETPASAGTVDLGRAAVAISAGTGHTCAVLDNGGVRCWGSGGDGRLGFGNTRNIADDETPVQAGPPIDFGPYRRAVAISAGQSHTCAILDNGTVRCWGRGVEGQLGYGNFDNIGDNESAASAGPVPLGVGREAVAISAGDTHTCAVLDDGHVKCWGNGLQGRLGYGNLLTVGNQNTPADVDAVEVGRLVSAIDVGRSRTCALGSDGSLRCWGNGSLGALGYGNTLTIGDNEVSSTAGPVDVGARVVAIAQGESHTCAVQIDNEVRCWGLGYEGRLGYRPWDVIGDDEYPVSAQPVEVV